MPKTVRTELPAGFRGLFAPPQSVTAADTSRRDARREKIEQQSQRRLTAAMLSVYFHSLAAGQQRRGGFPAPQIPPLPLPQAIEILRTHSAGQPGVLRQAQWAALRDGLNERVDLGTLAPLFRPDGKPSQEELDDLKGQLDALATHRHELESDVVKKLDPNALLGQEEDDLKKVRSWFNDVRVQKITRAERVSLREAYVWHSDQKNRIDTARLLRRTTAAWAIARSSLLERVPNGKWTLEEPTCNATFDWQSQATTVTVSAVLTTDLDEGEAALRLAYALDPRHWATLSSLFQQTYLTVGNQGALYATSAKEDVKWSGRLFEEVELGWSGTTDGVASFENLLDVTYDYRPQANTGPVLDLSFTLARCLNSRVFNDLQPGGILRDNGAIQIARHEDMPKSAFIFQARKELKFADRTPGDPRGLGPLDWGNMLNYWAPAALCMWMDGDVRQLCNKLNEEN